MSSNAGDEIVTLPVPAFDGSINGVSSPQGPLVTVGQEQQRFPRSASYEAASRHPWYPYLEPSFVNSSFASGLGFEQPNALDVWLHASPFAGPLPNAAAGESGWSDPGLGAYHYAASLPHGDNHGLHTTATTLGARFQPEHIHPHLVDYQLPAHEPQQLPAGHQHQYQDVVLVTVVPEAFGLHAQRELDLSQDKYQLSSERLKAAQTMEYCQRSKPTILLQKKARPSSWVAGQRDISAHGYIPQPDQGITKRGHQPKATPSEETVGVTYGSSVIPTPLIVHTSHSPVGLDASGMCSSPGLYRTAALLSIADGSSRRELFGAQEQPATIGNHQGTYQDPYHMSPTTSTRRPPSLSVSPTTVSATSFTRPVSCTHWGGRSTTSVSSGAGTGTGPGDDGTENTAPPPAASGLSAKNGRRPGRPRGTKDALEGAPAPGFAPPPAPASVEHMASSAARGQAGTRRRHSSSRLSQPGPKVRNRAAATKCRLKTKAMTVQLEAVEAAEAARHATLSKEAAALRETVYRLHSMLLDHADCDCELIQAYLFRRARELADQVAEVEECKAPAPGLRTTGGYGDSVLSDGSEE